MGRMILYHGSSDKVIQYCVKSERAYSKLTEIGDALICVDYSEFNDKYNQRDINARNRMQTK